MSKVLSCTWCTFCNIHLVEQKHLCQIFLGCFIFLYFTIIQYNLLLSYVIKTFKPCFCSQIFIKRASSENVCIDVPFTRIRPYISLYWSKALLASISSFLNLSEGKVPSSKGGSYVLLQGDLKQRFKVTTYKSTTKVYSELGGNPVLRYDLTCMSRHLCYNHIINNLFQAVCP